MEVHYHNRSRLPENLEQGATYHESLDTLLPVSDFLSLHCPATPESTGLMNAARLAQLPKGAILVNTARGALVVEDDLLAAIESGHLAAAGLDCFVTEPGGNPKFACHYNIFMLPHIGSATRETRVAPPWNTPSGFDCLFSAPTLGRQCVSPRVEPARNESVEPRVQKESLAPICIQWAEGDGVFCEIPYQPSGV